jgi:hypothetical protein
MDAWDLTEMTEYLHARHVKDSNPGLEILAVLHSLP